jgi:hypothetical protein
MQYIRRRIQRVSGVTIRDERVSAGRRERAAANRDMPSFKRQGLTYRERS